MNNKLLNISSGKYLKDRYSFFVLNSIGWLLFWLFSQIIIIAIAEASLKSFGGNLIAYFSGYLTTFILRVFYRKIKLNSLSEFNSWLYIIILCIIHAHIWIIIDFVIFGLTMYDFWALVDWFNIKYYLRTFMSDTVRLCAWSFLYFVIKIRIDWSELYERKRNAELLNKNLQIQMLQYQLNPHFLFNSLNSIRALMLKDVKSSREMVSELSEFLKYSLINKNNPQVPIIDEIESVKNFLRIEKIRYKEKLEISFDIEEETKNKLIPSLILYPIVENAIKYGMETSTLPLKIRIKTSINDSNLVISISNTGKLLKDNNESINKISGTNTGLNNVREILMNVYSKDHDFNIFAKDDCVIVRIVIGKNELE